MNVCYFCKKELKDNRTWISDATYSKTKTYHTSCRNGVKAERAMHKKHARLCHLPDCAEYPIPKLPYRRYLPEGWVDETKIELSGHTPSETMGTN